jgi:hypothetical protein
MMHIHLCVYPRSRGSAVLFCVGIVFAASLAFILNGCAGSAGVETKKEKVVDLKSKLFAVSPVPQDMRGNQSLQIVRHGLRKESLILVAPVSVRASLSGIAGKATLKGRATPVFNVGDGIQMSFFINRAATLHPVGTRYFDAGRNAEDRNWIPIEYALDLREGDMIEIEISSGPQGDYTADWIALSSLDLVQRDNLP